MESVNITCKYEISRWKMVMMGFVGLCFIVFGIIGNTLVIISVVRNRHLHSVPHYFIVNLAVADLLLSSMVVPFTASLEMLECWMWGRTLCDIWLSLDVLCCTASIFNHCVISMDRCVAISNPLRYPSLATNRLALGAVVGVWVASAAISVGPLFGWKDGGLANETVCEVNKNQSYVIFSNTCSFYLPLAVILVMYSKVYVVARRHMQRQKLDKAQDRKTGTMDMIEEDDEGKYSSYGTRERLRRFSKEMKAAKTLAIVLGCFILCWLPFFLVLPISSFSEMSLDAALGITAWFCYFNSCLNPIIYPCVSKDYRKAFICVLKNCFCCKSTSNHDRSTTTTAFIQRL